MFADLALGGLFLSAFGAATLLPLQSEAVLVALALNGEPWLMLLIVASVGNILGSLVNWWLGRSVTRFEHKAWYQKRLKGLERMRTVYQRYGYWSLLLSWMPIIGDPLTLIAGLMREPLWRFVLLVSIAKVGRYGVLLYWVI